MSMGIYSPSITPSSPNRPINVTSRLLIRHRPLAPGSSLSPSLNSVSVSVYLPQACQPNY